MVPRNAKTSSTKPAACRVTGPQTVFSKPLALKDAAPSAVEISQPRRSVHWVDPNLSRKRWTRLWVRA